MVQLVRQSLHVCRCKHRKTVAAGLRRRHEAAAAGQAATGPDAVEEQRAGKSASIARAWRRAGAGAVPFPACDPALRTIICTTHAMPGPSRVIRTSTGTRGPVPTGAPAAELICPALRTFGNVDPPQFHAARNPFARMPGARFSARPELKPACATPEIQGSGHSD